MSFFDEIEYKGHTIRFSDEQTPVKFVTDSLVEVLGERSRDDFDGHVLVTRDIAIVVADRFDSEFGEWLRTTFEWDYLQPNRSS